MTAVWPDPIRKRRTIYLAAAIVLFCLLVYAATMAVIEWQRRNDLNHVLSQRNQIALAAGNEAVALSTYDYQDLGTAKSRILKYATGAFAQQEETNYTAVAASITKLQATGTATVEESLASDENRGQAEAFVVVATSTKTSSGTTSGNQFLRMNLVLVGGQWKVEAIQPLDPPSS